MGDAENSLPPSKKRAAGREISKENPGLADDEGSIEQETGTFKKANDQVLASRRIVKFRCSQPSSPPAANPFAGIHLVPPSIPAAPTADNTIGKIVTGGEGLSEDTKKVPSEEVEKDGGENPSLSEPSEATASFVPVRSDDMVASGEKVSEDIPNASEVVEKVEDENIKFLESKTDESLAESATHKLNTENGEGKGDEAAETKVENMKQPGDKIDNEKTEDDKTEGEDKKDNTGENVDLGAEGFPLSSFQQLSSSQNAFTGLAGTGFSSSMFTFGSLPKDGSAFDTKAGQQPGFGFSLSNNGSSSLFSTSGSSTISNNGGSSFPLLQEVPVETGEENEKMVFKADSVLFEFLDGSWKERGKGEVKVNISTTVIERARLLMRCSGNYRLILNAGLYPEMKLTDMDKRGVTFACMNSTAENKDSLSTYALKFKDGSIVEKFRAAITAHKGEAVIVLKTPENSPKASEN